jgi:anti-sigma factor RsiW
MTQNIDCNKLDAYLADDLPVDDALRFESHLEECGACREATDEQHWVDSLLQSPVRIQLERTPATILDLLRSSQSYRRRHVWQAACGLAAAAVFLIAFGWIALHNHVVHSKRAATQNVAVVESANVPANIQPQATFVATSDAIVVPLESPSGDVTIVQVYPTTDTERRRRFEQSLLSASTMPNGG